MKTAIDTSALFAIFNNESNAPRWVAHLTKARAEGRLVICDVVYAELAAGFKEIALLDQAIAKLGIVFEAVNPESAFLAGRIHRLYRDAKGPRQRMIPDFLIGSHALCQTDRLAAADRGYFRDYFEDLSLLTVET
jgi:predicted nucleic acid-binding protein